jgi:uncharacterized membrane protein YuzA (DUF378 family)
VFSPPLFAAVLVPGLLDPAHFLEGGVGDGTIGVPMIGITGGYALSGRGRRWTRAIAAIVGLAGFVVWALTVNPATPGTDAGKFLTNP